MGACPHLQWGGAPPFLTPKNPSCTCAEESSLTSREGTLSLYFSRAQLSPLVLSLECLGENNAWILLHLTSTRYPAQRPIYLLPHSEPQFLHLSLGGSGRECWPARNESSLEAPLPHCVPCPSRPQAYGPDITSETEQRPVRLLGPQRAFWSAITCRQDYRLLWVPKGRSEQLLIREEHLRQD